MDNRDVFLKAYEEKLNKQALNRKTPLTEYGRRVGLSIAEAGILALRDSEAGAPKYRVVSAPTGSGKSSYAFALIAAVRETFGNASIFLCETIDQCEESYRELVKLLPEHDVAVWTSAHDLSRSVESVKAEHGFNPAFRICKSDLGRFPVVVVTHSFYKGVNGHLSRAYCGVARSLTVLDERPNEISTYDVSTGDIKLARDYAAEVLGPESAAACALDVMHTRMEREWQDESHKAPFKPLEEADIGWFISEEAKNLSSNYAKLKPSIDFGRCLYAGCCFLSRYDSNGGKGGNFVGYSMDMPLHAGTIMLDATSDIDGIRHLTSNRAHVNVPQLDFSRLNITHLDYPDEVVPPRSRISQLLQSADTAEPYAAWIKEQVLAHTSLGEKVLVVVHLALLNHRYLPNGCNRWATAHDLEGRQVCFSHWGTGIGANHWRDATSVFLFGEFHQKKRLIVANALGHQELQASAPFLSEVQSPNSKNEVLKALKVGHLLRWERQLAMRGNARNIDANGVCGEQKLFVTAELTRFAQHLQLLFPGARLKASNLRSPERLKSGGKKALLELLCTSQESAMTTRQIKDATGIDLTKNKGRYLGCSEVQQMMDLYGWQFVSGGGRGNLSRFRRERAEDYGFVSQR
jgi:hypothetical protein